MRVAVTGSSGLIGTALLAELRADGHEVRRLVRRPAQAADEIPWDPQSPGGGIDPAALEGTQAVVHLAGAPVAGWLWTRNYKEKIRTSRVAGTQVLAAALAELASPPAVLLTGSAVGWYGDTADREADETWPAGPGFLADVVRDWEAAAAPAAQAGIRVAHLRTGIVLSPRGGTLGKLLPLFRLGLGARLGRGTQYMSWISLADEIAAIRFLIGSDLSGPVNLTAPQPVTNAVFTVRIARSLHRPALLTVPSPVLTLLLGGLGKELLKSQRVLPRRLLTAGYSFQHADLDSALAAETGTSPLQR